MAKNRVFSHEEKRLKNEKHFPFFFYLFANSSLMTVYILLQYKILKSVGKHLPSSNLHPTKPIYLYYKSNDWFPYETSP